MKTPEELAALKAELENLNVRLSELTEEELNQIAGGGAQPLPDSFTWSGGDIVARAIQELGKPYAWGAVGPAAYDCSGLVSYVYQGCTCSSAPPQHLWAGREFPIRSREISAPAVLTVVFTWVRTQ